MATLKKVTKKAAKKTSAKKTSTKKSAGKKSSAKKSSKAAAKAVKTPGGRSVNVGPLDVLRHDLKGFEASLRARGLGDVADKIGEIRNTVHQVFVDLIGGPGNGPNPNKLVTVR